MDLVVSSLAKATMITAFVAAMMVLVEYVNVQTRGLWIRALGRSRWRQYATAAFLGAIPGCLGAYVVVALFVHRRLSLGAVVATMIATSGDESFVMLAMFPGTAIGLTVGLAALGVLGGALTDALVRRRRGGDAGCDDLTVHEDTETCRCFPGLTAIRAFWRPPSVHRAAAAAGVIAFLVALATGLIGPPTWDWKRVTFGLIGLLVLFITATVPTHFFEDHVWKHVLRTHVPRIFAWTAGTVLALALLDSTVDVRALVDANPWPMLGLALLISVVPESGPHLVFVTLYASGALPLGVLVASSVAQDGHGMLPLLAHSRRDFAVIKLINIAIGGVVGVVMLLL